MKSLKVLSLSPSLHAFVPQPALGQNFNSRGHLRKSEGAIPNSYADGAVVGNTPERADGVHDH
jgi:hypothetical protein